MLGVVAAARALSPSDFGQLAIGLTFCLIATSLSDGGLGAGMIRRQRDPARIELRAIMGLQLTITSAICLIGACLLPFSGRTGALTVVMLLGVPSAALRTPALILTERKLDYAPVARADLAQASVTTLITLVGLAVGFGVWSVAAASALGLWAGAITAASSVEGGWVRPSLRIANIRSVLRFGVQFQAIQVVLLIRDQGLNLGLGAIGGPTVLGLWSLARRVLQPPMIFFNAVWRVSFPAASIHVSRSDDLERPLGSIVTKAGLISGLILAITAAASLQGIPVVFGDSWEPVGQLMPAICAVLAVTGSVSVGCSGILSAAGRVDQALRATVASTVAWLAVTLGTVSAIGLPSVAIGFAVASLTEAALLSRTTHAIAGRSALMLALRSAAPALTGGAVGVLIASNTATSISAVTLAAAASCAVTIVLSYALFRPAVTDIASQAATHLRGWIRNPERAAGSKQPQHHGNPDGI